MESLKKDIDNYVTDLSYLEKLDEAMIWDSYKEGVPLAIAEVDPAHY